MASIQTVVSSTAASGTSKTIGILDFTDQSNSVVWQINQTSGTVAVQVKGSLDGTNFFNVGTSVAANSVFQTIKYPYMNVTWATNAGTITVLLA